MKLIMSLAALALIATPVVAKKDVKLPADAKTATKTAQCRDAKGKFAKCSAPGSIPSNPAAVIASEPAKVNVDKNGKCHVSEGPKKGQFTACPKK